MNARKNRCLSLSAMVTTNSIRKVVKWVTKHVRVLRLIPRPFLHLRQRNQRCIYITSIRKISCCHHYKKFRFSIQTDKANIQNTTLADRIPALATSTSLFSSA